MDTATTLIWSQDELLAAEAVEDICRVGSEGTEIVSIDAETSIDSIEEALVATSLFAPHRIVVVRNASSLRKAGIDRLSAALARDERSAAAIVVAVSEKPPAQLLGAIEGKTVRLTRPRRGELIAWVAKRMKRAGLAADRDAAAALVEGVGEGLLDLDQAIDQLAVRAGGGGRVDRNLVAEHFSPTGDQPIWTLFDAIVRHDAPKAFGTLHGLLEHGDEPLPVLGAIVSQIRGVIRAKAMLERSRGVSESDVARELGVSPGRAGVLRRQAAQLRWDWLLRFHRSCAEADYELKGGEDGAVLPSTIVLDRLVAGALD